MKYRPMRRPTDCNAVLIAESGDYSVKLRNIAPQGVKVTGLGGFVFPESDVTVVVQGRRLPGTVCWVDQETAGVKLNMPMPKSLVALIARTGGARGTQKQIR